MDETKEIPAIWNGSAFVPDGDTAMTYCRKALQIGEPVTLFVLQARSEKTHRHQFAWLHDALESLPEKYAGEPWAASTEHLRKYALISTGFFTATVVTTAGEDEAWRWKPILQGLDPYSIVSVKGDVIYRFVAQSQSMKAMGKERFQRSKTEILNFVARLIGVLPEDLARMGATRRKRIKNERNHHHPADGEGQS